MKPSFGQESYTNLTTICKKTSNLFLDESKVVPQWNFYKYLINHEGKVVQVYPPRVSVNEAFDDILRLVKKARLASQQKPKTVKKDLKDEL